MTESYLGLDQETRECQNKEPFYNCTTRAYLEIVLKVCGCLPANILLSTREQMRFEKLDIKFSDFTYSIDAGSVNIMYKSHF